MYPNPFHKLPVEDVLSFMSAGGNSGKQQQIDASVSNYFVRHSLQQFFFGLLLVLFGNVLEEHSFEQIFQPFLTFEGMVGCHLWCMKVLFEHCSSK
jgi:hypothetical protein